MRGFDSRSGLKVCPAKQDLALRDKNHYSRVQLPSWPQYMDSSKIGLLGLPIGYLSKIGLYLVIVGQKPACEVFANEPIKNESGKIKHFLKREGLFFRSIPIYDTKDERAGNRLYLVSRSPLLAQQLKAIWIAKKWGTRQQHLKHGLLVGFPKKAVETYTRTVGDKEEFAKMMLSNKEAHQKFRKESWGTYLTYIVRRGYEKEDAETARRWAETVQNGFPELAHEFETWVKTLERF